MTAEFPPNLQRRPLARKRHSPVRDAALSALLIFACFAGSSLWIYYQARQREFSHHREALETAAQRAAASVGEKHLRPDGVPPTADERAAAMLRLVNIKLKDSPVGRIAVISLRPDGHVVVYDTDKADARGGGSWLIEPAPPQAVPGEEAPHLEFVSSSGMLRSVTRPDGTIKVYAPIRSKAGATIGVATVESDHHTLEEGLSPIRFAALSSVVLGVLLSALTGIAVFTQRRKTWLVEDRLMVEALGQIFYEFDAASDRIRWRGQTEGILGASADRLAPTGLDWEERIHPVDREAYRNSRRGATWSGPYSVEYRVRREDGRYLWLLDRGGKLPSDPGAGSVIAGVILDMTASREAEQRLRDVVDAAGEYIWEVDPEGRYTYISERVREVLGCSPEEMIGRQPFDFVPPEDLPEMRATSDALVTERIGFRDFEHRFVRADGRIIWLSVNGVATFDADGKFTGYRGAGLDITSRKEAEQALIREKEAANAAVKAKSQFLAMMSHEIRTPMNSVIGFADLLSSSPLDDGQRDQLEMILKSGDALLALLNDILDFSRLESAALPVSMDAVDLLACCQEVVDLYKPAAESKGLRLSLDIAREVPAIVRTDRSRLRQILLNLVGNAVKFTDQGEVRVDVRTDSGHGGSGPVIDIAVRDTGVGIPEEKRGLLFHPFSQVDSSATRRFGGTGLGLAICRRLAELLGGRVGLRTSGPQGSEFFFSLPMPPGGPADQAEPGPVKADVPKGRLRPRDGVRVLVAEDNRVNLLLLCKMLSALGITCETVSDGSQCVSRHAESPFDLILMDVQMPVLDGLSAARAIRAAEAAAPGAHRVTMIAITADAMSGDRERCLQAGMDDYLSKPIRSESLAAVLQRNGFLQPV